MWARERDCQHHGGRLSCAKMGNQKEGPSVAEKSCI